MSASFDRIARPYRTLEYLTLGHTLERTRLCFLPHLLPARHALILGDGDGRFIAEMLNENSSLTTTAIDISAEMLRLLRQRCSRYSDRLRTEQANAVTWSPAAGEFYDLVVTHFFLDCLNQGEVDRLVTRLAPHLTPGARWLVSDFRIPDGALRWPARALVRALYLAFRILTGLETTRLPDHAAALEAAGLRRTEQRLLLGGILTTELWQRDDNRS